MNQLVIDNLTKLFKQYKMSNDPKISRFKSNVIYKLINIIKEYNKEIKDGNELKDIKGVGKGSIDRINEILKTSTLKELNSSNNYDIILEISKISGVGKVKAKELVLKEGIQSISELREKVASNVITLTHHAIIGLKYYEDINKRIPRKEMDAINVYMANIIKTHIPNLIFSVCGSYRRGLSTSGDIDILVSDKSFKLGIQKQKFLQKLVDILIEQKFILDNLTTNGSTKYMGICKLPRYKTARRIDIRCVNYNSFYTALLYFTGSRLLNINMRNNALENGYKLNEYSIYNIKKKQEIFPKSEEEIFELCGMDYIPPTERNL